MHRLQVARRRNAAEGKDGQGRHGNLLGHALLLGSSRAQRRRC
jgi:hypothetical protein